MDHDCLDVSNYSFIGVTSLLINNRPILLTSALEVAERELMGDYAHSWPLTKVLDIGGDERCPKYSANTGLQNSESGVSVN